MGSTQQTASFSPMHQLWKDTFFRENPHLQKIKPSAPPKQENHTPRRVTGYPAPAIYPARSINYAAILAAFDRNSQWQELNLRLLSPSELMASLQKIVKCELSTSSTWKDCFDDLLRQFRKVEEIRKLPEGNAKETAKQEAINLLIQETSSLKIGQHKLIVINIQSNDFLFYLFSKEETGFTLKIIGRGPSLMHLSEAKQSAAGGKVKIPSVLVFKNIPEKNIFESTLLKDLLINSLVGYRFSLHETTAFLQPLKPYRKHVDSSRSFASKTDHLFKNIWTALRQVDNPVPQNPKGLHRRFYLRLELGILFQILRDCGETLKADSAEERALRSLFRTISEDSLRAFRKGYIDKTELGDIVEELSFANKILENIEKNELPPLDTIKAADMARYTNCTRQSLGLQPPLPIQNMEGKTLETAANNYPPPIRDSNVLPLPKVNLKQEPVNTIKVLLAYLTEGPKLPEGILHLNFFPYRPKDNQPHSYQTDYEIDPTNMWAAASQAESLFIMEKMNEFSSRLVDNMQRNHDWSLDHYEALLKMTAIVLFLNTRWYNFKGMLNRKSCSSSSPTHFFSGKIDRVYNPSASDGRIGRTLSRIHIQLGKELSVICRLIEFKEDKSLSENQSQENFRFFISQLDQIDRLEEDNSSSFFSPSNMQKWMRPLTHPFLIAAYHNLKINISEKDEPDNFRLGHAIYTDFHSDQKGDIFSDVVPIIPIGGLHIDIKWLAIFSMFCKYLQS